nr:hypothetical protein [Limnohabitans sp. Rim11]
MWLASYMVHLRKVHWRAGADWLYGHLLEHTVHALVASVLLRITGLDALNLNAQTQPPHRQLAQPM